MEVLLILGVIILISILGYFLYRNKYNAQVYSLTHKIHVCSTILKDTGKQQETLDYLYEKYYKLTGKQYKTE